MEEKKKSKWVLKCKDCSHIFYSGKYKPIKTEKKRRVLFSKRDFLRMIPGLGKLIKPKIIIEHNWERKNYFETEMYYPPNSPTLDYIAPYERTKDPFIISDKEKCSVCNSIKKEVVEEKQSY
jgi:hypothetical protein